MVIVIIIIDDMIFWIFSNDFAQTFGVWFGVAVVSAYSSFHFWLHDGIKYNKPLGSTVQLKQLIFAVQMD